MRFVNFVQNDFVPTMRERLETSLAMVEHFVGGWEVWAQVETAARVLAGNEHCVIAREVPYPRSRRLCDFTVDPNNAEGNLIWVELKVLLQAGADDLAARFLADVTKFSDEYARGYMGENTGGAIGFAPVGAGDVVTALRGLVPYQNRRDYSYYVFSARNAPARHRLDEDFLPANGLAIVVYWGVA